MRRLRVDWPTFWGALGFILIGGGFALFGGYQLWSTAQFVGAATEVQATVVANAESCDDNGCTWWPELRFEDDSGAMHWLRTRHGSSGYGWPEGTQITALHNPDFDYLRIPGGGNLWTLGGWFLGLGGLAFAVGVLLMVTLVFRREKPPE